MLTIPNSTPSGADRGTPSATGTGREELPARSFDGTRDYRLRINARGRYTATDHTPSESPSSTSANTLRREVPTARDALRSVVERGDQATQDTQLVRLGRLAEQGRGEFAEVNTPTTGSVLQSKR